MKQPETICLLNDSFPPLIDGVANAVCNYAKEIVNDGSRAMVLTPAHPQADDSAFPYPVIRYPSIDLRRKTGYMAGIPFSPDMARRASDANITLLHSHCPIASTLLGRMLRQIADAPLIFTYHTKFDVDIANTIHLKALQQGSLHALVENIDACDDVWAVSSGAAENLRSLGYEGEICIMPNGVDLPRGRVSDSEIAALSTQYALPENVPVYLFVGRMMWYKGIRIILDALAKLHAASLSFRMVFIGDGTDRGEIEAYAASCGILSECVFTGAIIDREIIRRWYCRADLFLFPSSFDTNGLVVREAAACSLASVLIRSSAAAEGVTHERDGFLIEENADSLYELLRSLYSRPEIMRKAGQIASESLYLSWSDAVKRAKERYALVIERHKNGEYAHKRKLSEGLLRANSRLMEGLGNLEALLKKIE